MLKGYFSSRFIHEVSSEVVSGLQWEKKTGNSSFVQLLPQTHVSPNNFENRFNFIKKAVLEKVETILNGALIFNQTPTKIHVARLTLGVATCGWYPNIL
jgi:hypothetical protein